MGQDVRVSRSTVHCAGGPFPSGKTHFLKRFLARTGAIPRAGSVDAGLSIGDASPRPAVTRWASASPPPDQFSWRQLHFYRRPVRGVRA